MLGRSFLSHYTKTNKYIAISISKGEGETEDRSAAPYRSRHPRTRSSSSIPSDWRAKKMATNNLARSNPIIISLLLFTAANQLAYGFPDGAPVDACVKPRPNQPYHGQARPQPPETNPYTITASSSEYGPGTQITVTIEGDKFKGFFVQARDSPTDNWVGSWAQTPNTSTHPECSAVTHADPREKYQATLIWNAPHDKRGQVYFTGTVLKDYGTFWSNWRLPANPSARFGK